MMGGKELDFWSLRNEIQRQVLCHGRNFVAEWDGEPGVGVHQGLLAGS